jgi:cytochrome c553
MHLICFCSAYRPRHRIRLIGQQPAGEASLFKIAPVLLGLAMALSGARHAAAADGQLKAADTIAQRAAACAACHGKEGRATSDGYFPRIAGKPAGYLYNQLINFRSGARQYPMMAYMVGHLSDEYLRELAEYFSAQHPPYPAPQAAVVSAATLAQGRRLVLAGDPARKIPACVACHGPQLQGVLPATPSLLGLPRDYINAQVGAWKNGTRRAAGPDCMARISKQLTPEDVRAISSWVASQPVPRDMAPAPSARPVAGCNGTSFTAK